MQRNKLLCTLHCNYCKEVIEKDTASSASELEASSPPPKPEGSFICGQEVVVSILDLERDEVSTPKGPRKLEIPKSAHFPKIKHWIQPEILLKETWDRKRALRSATYPDVRFKFPVGSFSLHEPKWEVQELMDLKRRVTEVKSSLPLQSSWSDHTKRMSDTGLVIDYLKKYYNAEFCTDAWGVMFETACAFELVPEAIFHQMSRLSKDKERLEAGQNVSFDSVHLGDTPAAFIAALNHFLKNSFKVNCLDWNWVATTLNPHHEGNDIRQMNTDDRLILSLPDHWTFLDDATGNIQTCQNVSSLIDHIRDKLYKPRIKNGQQSNGVLLVTADGGFDCENHNAPLQFAEIVTALKILRPGGSFLLKIFTFFEASTICHLYLLSCAFKKVSFFQPSTRQDGFCEVYVVCLQYLGDAILNQFVDTHLFPMIDNYASFSKENTILPLEAIPVGFIQRIKRAAEYFYNHQISIIQRNMSCYPSCDMDVYQLMMPYRKEATEQWLEWSEIKKLSPEERLYFPSDPEFVGAIHTGNWRLRHLVDPRNGTMMNRTAKNDIQMLNSIQTEMQSYACHHSCEQLSKCQLNPMVSGLGDFGFEKPYGNILSSRFCFGRMLADRENVRQIAKHYLEELENHGVQGMTTESICSGHNKKEVLDVLCFKKATWEVLTKTDFQLQHQDLTNIVTTVKKMEKGQSLFLCRFPLLTRLQNGLILSLCGMFEKVFIHRDTEKMMIGVMLEKFTGADQTLFRSAEGVLDMSGSQPYAVLQLLPIKTLLEYLPIEFIGEYNLLLLRQDTDRIIMVSKCVIELESKSKQ